MKKDLSLGEMKTITEYKDSKSLQLARDGYPGIESLRKLNELWMDNIGTPETSLQCEYVLNWNENNF